MKKTFHFLSLIVIFVLTGCGTHETGDDGIPEENAHIKHLRLSNVEIERRIREYTLDLDSSANLGELFASIAEGLGAEIEVQTMRISQETPVNLKNSNQSFVIQILETVTSTTRTRYEVRNGRIIFKDAN